MDIVLYLFTIGYLFQLAGTILLLVSIIKGKSINGLCIDTQFMFSLASLARCFWIFDTRLINLPLAYVEVIGNTVLGVAICYLCTLYKHTLIFQIPKYVDYKTLSLISLFLCYFFHPGVKNQYYVTIQMLVSFTIFNESLGLLPQFILMKKAREVEVLTSHYVMILMVARVFRLVFWGYMFYQGESFGYLIIADLLHTVFLCDFAYEYFKSIQTGQRILLP